MRCSERAPFFRAARVFSSRDRAISVNQIRRSAEERRTENADDDQTQPRERLMSGESDWLSFDSMTVISSARASENAITRAIEIQCAYAKISSFPSKIQRALFTRVSCNLFFFPPHYLYIKITKNYAKKLTVDSTSNTCVFLFRVLSIMPSTCPVKLVDVNERSEKGGEKEEDLSHELNGSKWNA